MLLKDKLIVVVYIGVEDCSMASANAKLAAVRDYFKSMEDESVEFIFAPDFETRSCRVDAINPKRISDEEYEKVSEMVEDYKNRLKKFEEKHGAVQG